MQSFSTKLQNETLLIEESEEHEVKQFDVTIHVSGRDLQTPTGKLRYSWSLDGNECPKPSTETKVNFPNLSEGEHLFEVKAIDADGYEDPTPVKLTLKINIPFYKEKFFIRTIIVSIIVIIGIPIVWLLISLIRSIFQPISSWYGVIDEELIKNGKMPINKIETKQRQYIV